MFLIISSLSIKLFKSISLFLSLYIPISSKSTGAYLLIESLKKFFIVNALDNKHNVINNIIQIIDIEITIVLILLLICLNTKVFKFLE